MDVDKSVGIVGGGEQVGEGEEGTGVIHGNATNTIKNRHIL